MRKRPRVWLIIAVVVLVAFCCAYLYVSRVVLDSRPGPKLEVLYVWDGGVKSLHIVNAKTGAEVLSRKWRRRVAAEADKDLPGIVHGAGLTHAVGRYYVNTIGPDVIYFPGPLPDPDLAKDPDVTPLMLALEHDDPEAARALIASSANVNAADQQGWTVLGLASSGEYTDIVQALLARGAAVNAADRDGETALMAASFNRRLATVRELVSHGANVNAASKVGDTPLMEAAIHSLPVVEFLLAHGANANAQDINGRTVLMECAGAGRFEMIGPLIKAGADVNAKDKGGATALSLATDWGHHEVVRLLRQAGAHD